MPMHRWNGSAWVPAQTLTVWDGTTWVRSKKVKVWRGSWVLAWVHPVTEATLSLSKSGVIAGETYNVTLTAPRGFPEGAAVTFRFTGYSHTVYPTEGSTTAVLSGASHASGGSYQWYADVTTKGGDTSFGPVSQSVDVPATAITLTAPAWALSTQSGSGGSASIASRTFTVDLSNPALVSRVSFQLSYQGGAWTEYAGWNSPGAQVSHTMTFYTPGSWQARAVATQSNGITVYSAERSVPCYIKHLVMTQSISPVYVGDIPTITASHTGDALGSTYGRWQYYYASVGTWTDWITTNPVGWNASGETDITFRWVEDFADGSIIRSNEIRSVVTTRPSTEITVNGGHCHNIQAGIDAAASQGKTLRLTGTFYCYTNVYVKDNVYVNATGAMFYLNSKSATPGAVFDAGRIKNDEKGNVPVGGPGFNNGYGMAGGFTWDGGTFDGNGEGCMTFSHSPGYTIKNATFYRYCSTGNTGHAIEMNSSGGLDNVSGAYTVQILDNQFLGTDRGQRTNSNDEPVQWDWNWNGPSGGSGAAPPVWNPGDTVSEQTQVMCHNVRIAGNTFHRLSESWDSAINGGFALCAIGGHDSADASVVASYRHNHFLIENNIIHGARGSTAVNPDKGAIHLYRVRQATARNNTLYGGVQSRYITAEDATDATYCSASGNASSNPALTGNNSIVVQNA